MNPKTTLAGLVTAIITMVIWALNSWVVAIPDDVTTFIIGGAIAVMTLFTDPQSFKEVTPKVMTAITTIITIAAYLLQSLWQFAIPDFVIAAAQAVGIFLLGWFLSDTK